MTDEQNDSFEFDVCLSFAGAQREYVRQVADILHDRGIAVFFDEYQEAKMWGKDLYEHLAEVYGEKARYCILFASKEYADSAWPSHERQNAQARALQDKTEYILPARFDDTKIPGLRPTIAYIDLTRKSPEQLADLFVKKSGISNRNVFEQLADRFDAEWRQDEELFAAVRSNPTHGSLLKAFRRASDLGIISSLGLRASLDFTSSYIRIANMADAADDAPLVLQIEDRDGSTVATTYWLPGRSPVDVAYDIASELRRSSSWEGEQNFYPESVFARYADALLFGLSMTRKGELGLYGLVFEIVDEWILTESWLIDKTYRYQILYDRFDEDDWMPHMLKKVWPRQGGFIMAFETAFDLIKKGILAGRLPQGQA